MCSGRLGCREHFNSLILLIPHHLLNSLSFSTLPIPLRLISHLSIDILFHIFPSIIEIRINLLILNTSLILLLLDFLFRLTDLLDFPLYLL